MLRDLAKIVDHAESMGRTEDDFEAASQVMLRKQFLWMDGHGQNKHYNLIILYQDYFENLFGALGFDLVSDQKYGYCGIIPRNSTPSLNKMETILLLLLAKLHDGECRKACTENGRSMPSPGVLMDVFVETTQQEKPNRTKTISSLERLAKQGVIQLGNIDVTSNLPQITVLPTINKVVSSMYLDELERFTDAARDPQSSELEVGYVSDSCEADGEKE